MKVYVVGAGPAGIMAAIAASRAGHDVVLLERNEKIGKKLYITGKGRCNYTNCSSFDDFTANIVGNKKFLFSALRAFDSRDAMDIMEAAGVPLKVERGNRVFPVSDKSSDIIKGFERLLQGCGVEVRLGEKLTDLCCEDGKVTLLVTEKSEYRDADAVIIATGGVSYPATGSTGDGYRFARRSGHGIVSPVPALTGIYLSCSAAERDIPWSECAFLQGISLKNVRAEILSDGKTLFSEFGEMLFTDRGVSGPIILTLSSLINRLKPDTLILKIDLKPALSESELDARILRDFAKYANKTFKNSLSELLPSGLIPFVVRVCDIPGDKKVNSVTKEERRRLTLAVKGLKFRISGLEPIERAVVTAGGISLTDIDPRSMRSKKILNLSFAGEVLDIDALTGGYNIQLALSTGFAAGSGIEKSKKGDRR